MAVHKCKAQGCNKLIDITEPYCVRCQETHPELKTSFREVARSYVYDNPNCSKVQLSDETGIPIKMIDAFIKEGTIILVESLIKDELCTSCKKANAEPGKKECSSCREKTNKTQEKVKNELSKKIEKQKLNLSNQKNIGFHSAKPVK